MQHCFVLSWKSLAISGVRDGHRNRKSQQSLRFRCAKFHSAGAWPCPNLLFLAFFPFQGIPCDFECFSLFFCNPNPHIQGKNMNKYMAPKLPNLPCFQAFGVIFCPDVCSYFCLVCGGWQGTQNYLPPPPESKIELWIPTSTVDTQILQNTGKSYLP